MHEVIRRIEYKGYQIQERRLTTAVGGVAPKPGGGREVISPSPIASIQWAVVKVLPSGQEEEVALVWSEADARRQIDERNG